MEPKMTMGQLAAENRELRNRLAHIARTAANKLSALRVGTAVDPARALWEATAELRHIKELAEAGMPDAGG